MTVLPAAFSFVVSLLVIASMWAWVFALKRLFAGQPLLPYEHRTPAPWGLLDICVIFVLWALLQVVALAVLGGADAFNSSVASDSTGPQDLGSIDSVTLRWAIVLGGIANLFVCGLGALLIVIRTGARWGRDLGLTLRHAGRDVAYGVVAFVMMAPIIYTIQLTLVQLYPSEHPLIESFRTNPTMGFYLVCVFSAAIAAPVFEEFVCRVLLQGLFERIAVATTVEEALFSLPPSEVSHALSSPAVDSNPYVASAAACPDEVAVTASAVSATPPSWSQRGLPILFSSLVFAGLHWGHGLDPIPLFFLALGLGYLYQRTHRILPCIVVHFLVNALALVMLAMSLIAE